MTHTEQQIKILMDPATAVEQRLDVARDLMSRYPFFVLPAVVALKQCRTLMSENEVKALAMKVALSSAARDPHYDILYAGADEFRNFYPDEPKPTKPTTEDAIDTFLQRYGAGRDNESETRLLERLIFNPVPDYASVLEQQQAAENQPCHDESASADDARIDAFIRMHAPEEPRDPQSDQHPTPAPEPRTPQPSPDSLLSESLAKFHIRRRQYDKALEIIQNLSITHPEKSHHYEAQLRFLKKLIKNQELKQE